jgi:nucleotide-binding universal stress UspA family protein
MAIKDILVHVDNTQACARRMELATRLAVRHEAHLIALFARAFGKLPNLSTGHSREIDKQREESQQRFDELARVNGLSAEFRVADCESSTDLVTDNVLVNARHVDLVILGQHDDERADGSVPSDLAESVVLEGPAPLPSRHSRRGADAHRP